MFKGTLTSKMAFASAALVLLSACQMSIPVTGQTSSGQVTTGSVIADLTDNNTLQFTIGESMKCRGVYNASNRSKVPVSCDNGVSGTAVVTPDSNDFDGVVEFKLSDGTSGRIATKGAARSTKPDSEVKDTTPIQREASPRKTSIFVGLLPQYVTSYEGKGFKVDVFKYFCQVTIAYKNTSSSVKSPQFKILFTNGNQTVGESLAYMPSTLPGGESMSFGGDACFGNPTYIMSGGT